MSTRRIALVTCRTWPALSASDRCYATALRSTGAEVVVAAWNSEQDQARFREADLVVIRASWDYHDDVALYLKWLAELDAGGIKVLNDIAMVTRFLDKSAFTALAGDEVATPRSSTCAPQSEAIARVLAAEAWERAVLKPVNGASGRGVQLVTPRTTEQALAAVTEDVGLRDLVVQEFIPEIAEGETQYVLFDGKVSHAVLKRPREGEFRTNSAFAPHVELIAPLPAVAQRLEAMVARMPAAPLYARVDVVMRGSVPVLLEFEVNEPGLWLDVAPPEAAERFARATMARLEP